MKSKKDIESQPRRATSRKHSPMEENANSSKAFIAEHREEHPDFSSKQVPIMKFTKHKSILLLGENKNEGKKEEGKKEKYKEGGLLNTFAKGTLLGINNEEAALTGCVVFQGKFKGVFEKLMKETSTFRGTISNIKIFEIESFQTSEELPKLETFNSFFKGCFITPKEHLQFNKAAPQLVDDRLLRKSDKKEYHVPVMVRMDLRKISEINLQNSSAEIAAVLHIAIRLNEEALGRIYNKQEKRFVEKHRLSIALLMPFYNPTDFEEESDTDDETLYEWDDVWEGIDYDVEWQPEEMVMRYRIQTVYTAEIDNTHGIFWAPFSLSVLKIIIDFHSVDVKDHKICFNCCDSPYIQFSDLPRSKHIDRLSKFDTLASSTPLFSSTRASIRWPQIASPSSPTTGVPSRTKTVSPVTMPGPSASRSAASCWSVKSIKESYDHYNQLERHFIFSADRWEFVHIEIPIFKYPVIDMIRIFVPIIILSAISLTIFVQENAVDSGGFTELAKRIASSCSLMIAYIALIPLIRRNLPPTPSVTLVEILIYISTIPNFLTIISVLTTSFVDYQDFFDNYRPFLDPLFRASFAICLFSALTLAIVMIVYACKDYKTAFTVRILKPSPLKNLRSPVCLKYFHSVSKMRKEEFRIEQIHFKQENEYGS